MELLAHQDKELPEEKAERTGDGPEVEVEVPEALGRIPHHGSEEVTVALAAHSQSGDHLRFSQPVAVELEKHVVREAPEEAERVELGLSLPQKEPLLEVEVEEGITTAKTITPQPTAFKA
jgi:hypothetical protein